MAKYPQQIVEDLSLRFNEPSWRLQQRKEALEQMETLALPSYERMPIDNLELTKVDVTPHFVESSNIYNFTDMTPDKLLIVQEEEETIIEQMPTALSEQGVILTDLMTAFTEHSDLVRKYFMSVIKANDHQLAAYNSAFLTSGIFLYVPKNVTIKEPIESLFMQSANAHSSFVKHVLIVAEENSELTYIEHLASADTICQSRTGNMIVEVVAKVGAKVQYAAIDESAKQMNLFLERKAHLAKDATVDFAIGSMNKGTVVADFDVELIGDGASSNQHVVAISTEDQKQFINTQVNHYGKFSKGDIMQRGVVLKNGDLRFNGIGHIYPEGKNAQTTQESRLLMLTDKGRGDANPMLLIDHDEVVASHAASVGQLDVETLFYLMSRGLSEEQVLRLQTYAFLNPVMKAMPNKEIQDELFVHLERALD